jgi:hypothetical protein
MSYLAACTQAIWCWPLTLPKVAMSGVVAGGESPLGHLEEGPYTDWAA